MLNNSSYSDSKGNIDLNSNQQGNHTSNNSFSNNISNSNSSNEYQNREISNSNLNGSTLPMNNISSNNISESGASNDNTNDGILSKISNFFKNLNPWKIEEEECIDAHGFKCKRPKTKIPLRKKDQSYEDEIEKTGGESMTYATQHSGFGNMFL